MNSLGIYALYALQPIRVEVVDGQYAAYDIAGKPLDLTHAENASNLVAEADKRNTASAEAKKTAARTDLLRAVGNQDVVDLLLPDSLFVVSSPVTVDAVGNGTMFKGKIHDETLKAALKALQGVTR